jgi:SHS2 domain-containing protein
MNKQFEILPHTADVRLKVFGKTKEKLFQNALLGMAAILKESPIKNKKLFKIKIGVKSPDINSLLIDFLSEVLYRSQVNKAIYRNVEFSKFSDTEIEAEIFGFKVDAFDEDIKAVTYHELEIKKTPPTGGDDGFEAIIIFDV